MVKNKQRATIDELTAALKELDDELARRDPDARATLAKGATATARNKLAKKLGTPLRADVAAFFGWHDGQARARAIHPDDNRTPLSIAEAIEAWTFLCDPKEDVNEPWSQSWLPLFTNGAGDYLCIEMAGEHAGALVEYWHTDRGRKHAYPGLYEWARAARRALAKLPAAKAPKPNGGIDARGVSWKPLGRGPSDASLRTKPVGTALYYTKLFPSSPTPLVCLFVKYAREGERTWWKSRGQAADVAGAIAALSALLARAKKPDDYEWKADDFDVAFDCREDAFDPEVASPIGLHEAVVRVPGAA